MSKTDYISQNRNSNASVAIQPPLSVKLKYKQTRSDIRIEIQADNGTQQHNKGTRMQR